MWYLLAFMTVVVVLGLFLIWDGTRQDRWDEREVEFSHHPFIASPHDDSTFGPRGTWCVVWSLCGTDQCGLGPEDHVYNREDAPHEW